MKRKRRRRSRDEERLLAQAREREEAGEQSLESAGPEVADRSAQPLQQAAVLQMQQQVGNAQVQRYLDGRSAPTIQRQAEEEESAQNGPPPKVEPYEFDLDLQLRAGGRLEMNLKPALDLMQYLVQSDDRARLPERVSEWRGLGQLALLPATFAVPEMRMSADGRLSLPVTDGLLRRLAHLSVNNGPEGEPLEGMEKELALERIFGRSRVQATATLHFNTADPEIADLRLDKKSQFLGSQNRPGLFLLLQFEADEMNKDVDPLRAYLDGLFLFEASGRET
jgi:hypothetical protein